MALWDIVVQEIGTPQTMVGWVLMDIFVFLIAVMVLFLIAMIPYIIFRKIMNL